MLIQLSMKAKTLTLALTTTVLLLGSSSASAEWRVGNLRIGHTAISRLVTDRSIPGKGTPGQCMKFALALREKLQLAGIPAEVVVYGYDKSNLASASERSKGMHAIVVYQDGDRTYAMDNQSWSPRWLQYGSPGQVAAQFSGIGAVVTSARLVDPTVLGEDGRQYAGRRADLALRYDG